MPQMSPLPWGGLSASVIGLVLLFSLVLYFLPLSFTKFKKKGLFMSCSWKW